MRIKYLSPIGRHKIGDQVDIDDGSGQWLIDRGLAERITERKTTANTSNTTTSTSTNAPRRGRPRKNITDSDGDGGG